MGRKLVSKPSDPEISGRRVEVAFREAERGEELTEKQVPTVQRETAINRCRSCGPRVRPFRGPRRRGDGR